AQQVALGLGTDANVVFLGADPADVGDVKEEDAAAGLEDDAFGVGAVRCIGGAIRRVGLGRGLDLLAGALDGGVQTLGGERLQKIVDRVDFKGANGVTVVCR